MLAVFQLITYLRSFVCACRAPKAALTLMRVLFVDQSLRISLRHPREYNVLFGPKLNVVRPRL